MHGDTWEIALPKQLIQLRGAKCTFDEDNHLVELKGIKQIVELPILLAFAKLDIILLETMEGEGGLIVDVDFKRILHELFADRTDFL